MDYAVIFWFVLIIFAALIEMNTMDLTSIWFSAGALVAFILAIADAQVWIQILVFVIFTLGLIVLVRPITKKYLKTNVVHTNTDRLVGKVATCTKMILSGERGEVKIDGKYLQDLFDKKLPNTAMISLYTMIDMLKTQGITVI